MDKLFLNLENKIQSKATTLRLGNVINKIKRFCFFQRYHELLLIIFYLDLLRKWNKY
jgi:hypothetical protein